MPKKRRLVLLALVVVVLLLLVGVLILRIFLSGGGTDVVQPPPTATAEPTEEGPDVIVTPEDSTPTPTRVILEEPTEESTQEPTVEPTEEALPEPTVEPIVVTSSAADFAVPAPPERAVVQIEELLKNGDFEEGFDETTGVGLNWHRFSNGEAAIAFSREASEPFIYDGFGAQRISIENALYTDRYAGIYQKVDVVPDEIYTFSIRGQVRTLYGDINASGYGYRVQYAADHNGSENWQTITDTDWIELPWDEQQLNTSKVDFLEYTGQIESESDQMTLFVRVWNKWADPKLAEYTFDSLSLVGPKPGSVMMVSADTAIETATDTGTDTSAGTPTGTSAGAGEELIDQPLPVTGTGDTANLIKDGRFWGALLVLFLLAIGATYRAKWRW